jgi:predicted Fe-Mo cluster-binding NifX family protein
MRRIVGIPSMGPELTDSISEHFGHCDYFIGIEIEDHNGMKKVFSLKNEGHAGCMEPVFAMKNNKVTDMIIGGIGGRPFMGFLEVGINLYQGIAGSIKDNVELLIQDKLKPLGGPSCSGGDHAHHH